MTPDSKVVSFLTLGVLVGGLCAGCVPECPDGALPAKPATPSPKSTPTARPPRPTNQETTTPANQKTATPESIAEDSFPRSSIYLPETGSEGWRLVSWSDLTSDQQKLVEPQLTAGENFLGQLEGLKIGAGDGLGVVLAISPDSKVGSFAVRVNQGPVEMDGKTYPVGTLIIPGVGGEPLFLYPTTQTDKITPVEIPGKEGITWGLFTKTGQLVAFVDQYNRWSTESTLCAEFWRNQLPKMGISTDGMTNAEITRAGGDILAALKERGGSLSDWEQIPNGWQWQKLADQKAYEGGNQDGLLAVVVSPDGQVYVAEWNHEWGQDFGYFREDGKTPVGARRVKLLAPLPAECFDEQGKPRQNLRFQLSPEGALQVDVGDKIYTYDEQQKIWVVSERPKPEGMLDLEGFEERWNSDLNRWEYVDVDGQVPIYWNTETGRIELVKDVLEGRMALDFEKHRGFFVSVDPNWVKTQTDASLATDRLMFALPFDVRNGGKMWLAHGRRVTWLCVTGLPKDTVIKTPISGRLELWAFEREDKMIDVVDRDHDHSFSVRFHQGQLIHSSSGDIISNQPLITITDATVYLADRRKDFGSLRPQFNLAVGNAKDGKRGDWISFENILKDDKGRLVFMP